MEGEAIVDTGASHTFVDQAWVRRNEIATRERDLTWVRLGGSQNYHRVTRKVEGTLEISGHKAPVELQLIPSEGVQIYLGRDWLAANQAWIDVAGQELHLGATEMLLGWLQEYRKIFEKLGDELPARKQGHNHEIKMTTEEIPKSGVISLKPTDQKFVQEYTMELLGKGWIRRSKLPWEAPMFVINNGKKLRPVIDYRKLNAVTVKDLTLLPLIGNTMDDLVGAKYFTKMDLRDAFNQIRIKEGDE